MRIADQNDLTDLQAFFQIYNHLSFHHPFITPTQAATTHRAPRFCLLIGLHNDLAATIAAILSEEGGFICDLVPQREALRDRRDSIQPHSAHSYIDYIRAAMTDALASFARRDDKEKVDKHGPGCEAMSRDFAAAVFSTFGGLRGKKFLNLFAGIFAAFIAADRRAGGTGWAPAQRKVRAREYIVATLARGSARIWPRSWPTLREYIVDRPQNRSVGHYVSTTPWPWPELCPRRAPKFLLCYFGISFVLFFAYFTSTQQSLRHVCVLQMAAAHKSWATRPDSRRRFLPRPSTQSEDVQPT